MNVINDVRRRWQSGIVGKLVIGAAAIVVIVLCCFSLLVASALRGSRAPSAARPAPTAGGSVFVAPTFPSPATATPEPTAVPQPTAEPPTAAPPPTAEPTLAPTVEPQPTATEPVLVEIAPAPTAEPPAAATPVVVAPVVAPAAAPPQGETATLVRVVDGDTIRVIYNGAEVAMRYIGIDTPESKDPGEPVQCFAAEATNYNMQLVSGQTLILERDSNDRDKYGRLLRYVYLPDGRMVNEELVRAGMAFAKQYPPDVKHAARFAAAEQAAQAAGIGLWSSCSVANGKTNPVAGAQPTAAPQPAAGGAASPGGSAAPIDANTCPASHPIKGNQGEEWIYHQPMQSAYNRTNPEACFATPADAEAAGYRAAKR